MYTHNSTHQVYLVNKDSRGLQFPPPRPTLIHTHTPTVRTKRIWLQRRAEVCNRRWIMNEVLKVCAALLVLHAWLSVGFLNLGSMLKKAASRFAIEGEI